MILIFVGIVCLFLALCCLSYIVKIISSCYEDNMEIILNIVTIIMILLTITGLYLIGSEILQLLGII